MTTITTLTTPEGVQLQSQYDGCDELSQHYGYDIVEMNSGGYGTSGTVKFSYNKRMYWSGEHKDNYGQLTCAFTKRNVMDKRTMEKMLPELFCGVDLCSETYAPDFVALCNKMEAVVRTYLTKHAPGFPSFTLSRHPYGPTFIVDRVQVAGYPELYEITASLDAYKDVLADCQQAMWDEITDLLMYDDEEEFCE